MGTNHKEQLLNIGDRVGDSIYFGQYSPIDRDGINLGKIFNVYAALKDLSLLTTYNDAVKYIAEKYRSDGFSGTNYPTDKEIYAALKDGSYTGGWIIPTRELLGGTEPDGESGARNGKIIQPDNLFNHQNKGAFKNTFVTVAPRGYSSPQRYWSSTECRDKPSNVWDVDFSNAWEYWNPKESVQWSCRPVRLVEASAPAP